jgi:hypothetical protein
MAIVPFEHAFPVEMTIGTPTQQISKSPSQDAKIANYIITWRNQLRSGFTNRRNVWDECWALYRGVQDYSNREEWQSKIVLPKSWASVKQATNVIKRLLATSKNPWNLESVNPDDLISTLRAEQMTDLTKVFLEKADFLQEFSEGLECGFILGLGVWKIWWGLVPRTRTRVETKMIEIPAPMGGGGMGGLLLGQPSPRDFPQAFNQGPYDYAQQSEGQYPSQLPGEALNPYGWGQGPEGMPTAPSSVLVPQKQLIQEEILEGRLFIRAVDPYNFYWLPGSKLNRWVGTIEEVEVPKYELIRMVDQGYFSKEALDSIQPMKIDERYKMSGLRFGETVNTQNGPSADTANVKLTEFFGPLVFDGKVIEENAHVILANESVVLVNQKNPFLHGKSPYVGFSPLALPFRTEGVGLVEMVRAIDKALSQLANLSIDTLMFRLLPLFEVTVEAFENPEELETGILPGKMLRKNIGQSGVEGIRPVKFEDISQGTVQVSAQLDRAHHEGALISDVAEGLPRYRGQQSATETQILQSNNESYMGSMSADIERQAITPIVEMACDLIFQFIDTANDPRVASILGVGADYLAGMSKEEMMEMIQGDYKVKATGITGQLQKAEMLQNLVQFMNLIGQNPQAWLPYVNQDALLRRILEAFRPTIHDIEDIISDPAMAQAKQAAMQSEQITPDLLNLIPQLVQLQQGQEQQEADRGMELQRMVHDQEMQKGQMQMQQTQQMMDMASQQQEMQMREKELQAQRQQPQQGGSK